MRRLAGILAASTLGAAALLVTAPTAQAACPTAGHTSMRTSNLGDAGVDSWVQITTYWVRCDNGTPSGSDDYKRLASWRYDDGPKIGGSYAHTTYPPTPTTKWYCNGVTGNAITGWNVWGDNMTVTLNNAACGNWQVVVRARGEIDFWPDENYIQSGNL